jgi:hypothetical protein
MDKLKTTHPIQKEKSKNRRNIIKKAFRYPRKIYFLADDDICCICKQIPKAFIRKRKMKQYLKKQSGYISPQAYSVLIKQRCYTQGSTIYLAGKIKIRKQDILKLYNQFTSQPSQ